MSVQYGMHQKKPRAGRVQGPCSVLRDTVWITEKGLGARCGCCMQGDGDKKRGWVGFLGLWSDYRMKLLVAMCCSSNLQMFLWLKLWSWSPSGFCSSLPHWCGTESYINERFSLASRRDRRSAGQSINFLLRQEENESFFTATVFLIVLPRLYRRRSLWWYFHMITHGIRAVPMIY